MMKLRNPPPSVALPSLIESFPNEHRTESGVRKAHFQTSQGQRRVLLIAPSPTRGAQYERALAADCIVQVTESGDSAFQVLIGDRDFRLILFPGTTGEGAACAFLSQLRQLNLLCCPRVVVYEGLENAREVIEAIQLGVWQYIPGRCSPAELARKIGRLLGVP